MGMNNLFDRPYTKDDSGTIYSDWKWLIDNGTSVKNAWNVINSTYTLYTCPAGKVCYVITASLYWHGVGAALDTVDMKVNTSRIIMLQSSNTANDHDGQNLSFAIPLKLVAGDTLKIYSASANTRAYGGFSGYELDA